MKFSYSLIKKLLPQVPAKAKLAETLNSHSFEVESFDGDCFDISLASNRYSDAASHLGIAREGAAGLGLKLKTPVKAIVNLPTSQGFLEVKIENQNLCPRYAARYFEIRKISSSPLWMQKILKTCGLKPINTVVDLMNYVMLEVGQPLHAFDADKIAIGRDPKLRIHPNVPNKKIKIIVRRAKNGEKIEALDGQKFVLDSNDLVIADSEKALAVAGIKGGANSGVDKNTKRIIIEAANFDPVGVFKTSRKLKLITDASLRFDHGLSPALVDWGLDRATELLVGMGAKLIDSVDIYPKPVGEELIEFDTRKYEHLIGASISANAAKNYFRVLGFSIQDADLRRPYADQRGKSQRKLAISPREPAFLVRVPAWRTDIEHFEDLAEEVSRLSGYGKLEPQAPAVGLEPAAEENIIILKDRIRDILSHFHLDEVYNYSFVGLADARRSGVNAAELVELENPISQDLRYLLPNLEGGLLKNIDFNSRFFDTVKIFEIGNVFHSRINADKNADVRRSIRANPRSNQRESASVKEELHLGIALSAKKEPLIFDLKGIADEMLRGLGITDVSFVESGNSLRVESDHQVIASLRIVHLEKGPLRRSSSEASRTVSVAEFDLEKLLPLIEEEREFKPLPKYPAVVRDISLLVESDARIGEILEAIQKASPTLIEDVDLIDEYTPPAQTYAEQTQTDAENFPRRSASSQRESAVKRSLTFRIVFQAEDRTLIDAEVNKEVEKIKKALKEKFEAEIR